MVLLPDGRAKIRAEGFAEGLAEGRAIAKARGAAKVHAAWTSWLERMEECHARGEPFKEPTPDPLGGRPKGWYEGWDEGWSAGWIEGKMIGANNAVAQMHSAWADWNARRMEYQEKGEPFDEPPPAPPDSQLGGKGKCDDDSA